MSVANAGTRKGLAHCRHIAKHWGYDLDSPCCFACGWEERSWDRFDRAHIVAASIGGSVDDDNIFLLCRCCHEESPMTNSREVFLDWVECREVWFGRVTREVLQELARRGFSQDPIKFEDADGIVPYMKRIRKDAHPRRTGSYQSTSAITAIMAGYIRECQGHTVPAAFDLFAD